ncbi:molecular chaperone [Pedobacter sp. L105]|uniref:fimbrial biogenesis chaperone n=1 Tax=Pedobacter sp. L105 TaxID=1641871 RepID=UPI00131C7F94|nr:fimbria/pilus periplasmic chaperone [Pedobacter sp. L105]
MFIKPGFDKKTTTLLRYFIFFAVILTSIFYSSNVKAQGDLFINPKRIIFEGEKRSQEISLANIGNDTATYMVTFVQIRLKNDGNFEQIEQPDSGQHFADKNLRIFPRTITLAPKETQTIKIQLYQKEKLQAGEYRSHLYFRGVPPENPSAKKQQTENTKNVSVKITPVFGITIPVIIRIGENTTTASITDLTLGKSENQTDILKLTVNRKGNMSLYGDITVNYISAAGKTTRAGYIKGISVYTPNQLRYINLTLDPKAGLNYHSGKLSVSYTAVNEGKSEKIAAAELTLN